MSSDSVPCTTPSVAGHPIAVVVARTGASEHLLRVWERRYGAITPTRGVGGHRRYSDADVARLRLLLAVTRAGRPIGQVARLPTEVLRQLVDEDTAAQDVVRGPGSGAPTGFPGPEPAPRGAAADDAVALKAVALTRALDGPALDDELRRAAARLGVPTFLERVIAPLVRHVDEAWRAGQLSAAQERLAASTAHDLLVETMRALARGHARTDAVPRLVLATPPGVSHGPDAPAGVDPSGDRYAPGVAAVEAAAAGAAAAADGWAVVYLGPGLPAGEVAAVAAATAASAVAVHVPAYLGADGDEARVAAEVRALRARLPAAVPVLVSGAGAPALAAVLAEPGIAVGAGWSDLRAALPTAPGPADV